MEVKPGTLLRRRALGTEALYRVLTTADNVVEVEVVRAPGLHKGQRVRLTTRDVHAMQELDTSSCDAPSRGNGTATGHP
jgi:hypothetical protein